MSNKTDKPTILVVDDQPENIDVLSNLLRGKYRVKAATSGEKALEVVKKSNNPDLVLLDIMMPGIDGYEVCKRLKADSVTKDIPVIFVSALQNESDKDKAFECGAVGYIEKPINPDKVLKSVHEHIR